MLSLRVWPFCGMVRVRQKNLDHEVGSYLKKTWRETTRSSAAWMNRCLLALVSKWPAFLALPIVPQQ
jgi:hypothetical protein